MIRVLPEGPALMLGHQFRRDPPSEPITQKDFYQLTAYTYGVANLRNASGYSNENVREWRELQARLKAMDAPAALR